MSNDKIKISGIAVREGTSRNNRKYRAKELEKFAPTLIGKPILKDHEGITDNVIGKVTNAESLEDGVIVTYEGWVKEDGSGILEKLKDGRISEVSIGAIAGKIVKEKGNDDIIIPVDMEALELSTTPVPGNRGTSVSISGEKVDGIDLTEEGIKKMIEDYENSNSHSSIKDDTLDKIKKEVSMESKELIPNESVETKNMTNEISELKSEIESLKSEKESAEEARKSDAIDRYKEKAKAKGLKSKDLSNASMETIQMLIEMVDDISEPSDEESKEEDKESSDEKPKEEEKKEDEKEEAEPKSKEVDSDEKSSESFEGYVLDQSDTIHGIAFYKYY